MDKLDKVIAESKRNAEIRGHGYREQALKLFPWICGKCEREFTRTNLSELTVHHKDHNHDNNPADGSNWELLCIYCHDHEHSKYLKKETAIRAVDEFERKHTTGKPFASLKDLLGKN
jgi:HNH endonuclease